MEDNAPRVRIGHVHQGRSFSLEKDSALYEHKQQARLDETKLG